MGKHSRYQVVDLIGQGDYATVYRGQDLELNRQVAIKQIHPQFLNDPRQLERYWEEAKLLASLEHPYIMTIYDVVKDRGWLILELMQGSLEQKLDGQAIDLEDLRLTIIYMCHALGFLRKNGIVHGDVKPSNLMLDRNHRVKLGDFGIARRLASDDGSVVKGTTKYMAPEVVSDQFGSVGHHSDLYSLGFSAYALMCGQHFDALFPGLHVAGRDEQIAWMMWHSAADRQVPEIEKVLEGVPPALSRAIHKLTYKDPAKRYQTSEQVIADLKAHAEGKDPDELAAVEQAEREQEVRAQKKRRRFAYVAVALSLCLCLAMFFVPTPVEDQDSGPDNGSGSGTIASIDPARSLIGISIEAGAPIQGVTLNEERDRIFLNGQRVALSDLEVGDTISVEENTRVKDQQTFFTVEAHRPPERELTASIREVKATDGLLVVAPLDLSSDSKASDDQAPATTMELYVPSNVSVVLNGRDSWDGRLVKLADLQSGDRVFGRYVESDSRRVFRQIAVTRDVSLEGRLHTINQDLKQVSLDVGAAGQERLQTYPIADDCEVAINGRRRRANGQQIGLADLRMGDRVTIQHDAQVRAIDVNRELVTRGTITAIDLDKGQLGVSSPDMSQTIIFETTPETLIGLASNGESRSLGFARVGDRVVIEHESVDMAEPTALVVRLEPTPRTTTWCLVIDIGRFDDDRVAAISNASSDAALVEESVQDWYRVPSYQLHRIQNPTRLTLMSELDEVLLDVPQNAQLIVYVSSRAFLNGDHVPFLATREFEPTRMAETGLPLQEFIDRLEASPTRETMLLLDVGHPGMASAAWSQPSAEELISALKAHPTHPISQRVDVIGSCSTGEFSQQTQQSSDGAFATSIAAAFQGDADLNRDEFIDSPEMASYLASSLPKLIGNKSLAQTVLRFAPGEAPNRLHPETIAKVRELLAYLEQTRFDSDWTTQFEAALQHQPDQPDVGIAYALVFLRHDRTGESRSKFEQLRSQFPKRFVPHLALAWQELLGKNTDSAVVELSHALSALPRMNDRLEELEQDPAEGQVSMVESLAETVGQLSGYALYCAAKTMSAEEAAELEAIASQLPASLRDAYQRGIRSVEDKASQLDEQIKQSNDQQRGQLERERARLSTYSRLDFALIAELIEAQLEGALDE